MKTKKTKEKFLEELYTLVGDEYLLVGEYTGSKSTIELVHRVCNFHWKVRADSVIRGTRCPKCQVASVSRTNESFLKEVFLLVGKEYSVLSEYICVRKKVTLRHNTCGEIWEANPNLFLKGRRCPRCASEQIESRLATSLKIYFASRYNIIKEYRECVNPKTGYYLPYDIYVPKYKLYIEVNGQQHYSESSWSGKNLPARKQLDNLKKNMLGKMVVM